MAAIGSAQLLVYVGHGDGGISVAGNDSSNTYEITHLLANGAFDSGFGNGGQTTMTVEAPVDASMAQAVASPGNRTVSLAWIWGEPALIRQDASGALDSSFGYKGVISGLDRAEARHADFRARGHVLQLDPTGLADRAQQLARELGLGRQVGRRRGGRRRRFALGRERFGLGAQLVGRRDRQVVRPPSRRIEQHVARFLDPRDGRGELDLGEQPRDGEGLGAVDLADAAVRPADRRIRHLPCATTTRWR
jgi:hypothetical protein